MTSFLIINILVLILLSLYYSNLSILIIGLIGLLVLVIMARSTKQNCFLHLTIIFSISIMLMLIIYYGYIAKYGAPYYLGGSDDLFFEEYSRYVISQNYNMPYEIKQDSQFTWYSANGFLWILSWIIRFATTLGGYHTITYRILNIYFLLMLSVLVLTYFTDKYRYSRKQNLVVLYSIALFPNCQYINIHVFRDTLNVLLLFLVFYIWDNYIAEKKIVKRKLVLTLVITALLTYVLYWIRTPNLIFIGAIILVSLFLKDMKLSIRSFWKYILLVVVGVTFMIGLDIFDKFSQTNEAYTNYVLTISDGMSRKIFSMNLLPFGILLRIIYGLISPLPVSILQFPRMFNDIDIFFDVIIGIGTIAQIYMLPYLFRNIRSMNKVFIIFMFFLVTIVTTTYTFRHFMMLYPFIVILSFRQFFEVPMNKKIYKFMCITAVLIISACSYFLFKQIT